MAIPEEFDDDRLWVLADLGSGSAGMHSVWTGMYLPVPFLVVWLTFLVNGSHEPPFNVYRWCGHFEYQVDDRYEQQWLFEWARTLGCKGRTRWWA